MSKSHTIAKLEALLGRIQSRAAEPRTAPAPAATAAAAPTIPPPAEEDVTLGIRKEAPAEAEVAVGVYAKEVVAEAFESRERLTEAEPVAEAMTPEPVAPEPRADAAAVAEPEPPPELVAGVEEMVEEAPLSSRRPVVPEPEERLADMAFGAEEPSTPRHTAPPESGPLPASPTLELDGDVTGVREATPIAGTEPRRPRELVPESTRGALEPNDAVADVVGAAQRFEPGTFGALLDASLAL